MSANGSTRSTILLVDDEADILVALEDLLGDDYRVLTTTSPGEALRLLERDGDVAVIVSDQRMPEMPGNVFLAQARAHSTAEALLLTGYADIEAVISAVNDGRIAGYAHKPWDPEALRSMVASAADRFHLRRALAFEQAVFAALAASSRDRIAVLAEDGSAVRGVAPPAPDAADEAALSSGATPAEELCETVTDGIAEVRRIQRLPFEVDGRRFLLRIESDETERHGLRQRLQQAEKLTALGTLAGGIAHDFNNLLTAITGNLELAAGRAEDPRLVRYIANAGEAARRGAGLTKRLLSFSRQGEMAACSADPNLLIRGMDDLVSRAMSGTVTTALDLDPAAWPVLIDPEQLELAILNLAINARDAMPEGGTITLSTRNMTIDAPAPGQPAAGDYVGIAIHDTGQGMSDAVAARVFEPFFTTKARGHGTGLGLPMAHAMAENAGGTVILDTAEGVGTTVTVLLPRGQPIGAVPVDGAAEAHCRPLRVLLVDDDQAVREVSEEYLVALGHTVKTTSSVTEGMRVLNDGGAFDLVMTDYAMPGLSGLHMAEFVAQYDGALPVLLVTGFADVAHFPATVTTLRKPFTRAELATALAARIAGADAGAPPAGDEA